MNAMLLLSSSSGTTTSSTVSFVIMLVVMVALFYFLLLRPQQKQQKKVNEMLKNLKVGDRVKTIGGIYGRIISIKDDVIFLEVGANKVEIPFSRNAIGTVENVDAENQM